MHQDWFYLLINIENQCNSNFFSWQLHFITDRCGIVCDLLTEICFNWDIFRVEQGKNQEGEGRKEKDCCAACNKTVIATKMCPWKKVVKLYTPRPSPVNCQPFWIQKGQNGTKIHFLGFLGGDRSDFLGFSGVIFCL